MAAKKASTKKKTTTKTVTRKVTRPSSANSAKELLMNAPLGALFGELIGTFLLAAIVLATQGQPIIIVFALTAIVLAVGNLSGGHVNPAITFGAWATKKIPTLKAIGYIVFQVFGAMLAYAVLSALINGRPQEVNPYTGQATAGTLFSATPLVHDKEWYTFGLSLLGTAIFGFAVASAMRETKERFAAAFTVGGGLFLGLLIAGGLTILNPAVAVAVQAFADLKGQDMQMAIAVHVIAPLIGSVIGFFLYDVFRKDADTNK